MPRACIVTGEIPAEEFALYDAMEALPELEFEVERVVRSGEDALMPLMWVRNAEQGDIERAFEADPSVQEVTLLSSFEEELLYRMEWIADIRVALQMLTASQATITDAYGADDRWLLRVLYPNRDMLTKTTDFAEAEELTFDVTAVRELEGEDKPAGRYGLTETQFETIEAAFDAGYFDVPREVKLTELADQLDVSHQALSERLRRAIRVLVEDALLVGMVSRREDSEL
jgi:hypothetical protein